MDIAGFVIDFCYRISNWISHGYVPMGVRLMGIGGRFGKIRELTMEGWQDKTPWLHSLAVATYHGFYW